MARRGYPAEFRKRVLELVGSGRRVAEVSGDPVEVFSPAEVEDLHGTDRLIRQSEADGRQVEDIQRLAEEGRISREEMIRRLVELTREQPVDP